MLPASTGCSGGREELPDERGVAFRVRDGVLRWIRRLEHDPALVIDGVDRGGDRIELDLAFTEITAAILEMDAGDPSIQEPDFRWHVVAIAGGISHVVIQLH